MARLIDIPKDLFKLPMLEKLLARLTQEKPVGHFFSRLPPLNTRYPKPSIRQAQRNGIHYELDLSDYMEWLVFWGIAVEPRHVLYELVKPGGTAIDIGTNIGEVALNLAQRVGPSGTVHAFEPDAFIRGKLVRNIALNNFKNIRVNAFGLGEREEELVLQAEVQSNRGGTRIHRHLSQGQRVKLTTLDAYAKSLPLGSVDLIKLDVEGFEHQVILGARQTLRQFHPILFIEVDDRNLREQGTTASAMIKTLSGLGYADMVRADSQERVNHGMDFTDCHMDIVVR